jgi:hypothetical protein
MAYSIDVLVRQRFQDRLHWVLPNWSYRSHIRGLLYVALVSQRIAQTLQALVLPRFENVAEVLAADIAQEGHQVLEGSVRLLYHQIQVEESNRKLMVP